MSPTWPVWPPKEWVGTARRERCILLLQGLGSHGAARWSGTYLRSIVSACLLRRCTTCHEPSISVCWCWKNSRPIAKKPVIYGQKSSHIMICSLFHEYYFWPICVITLHQIKWPPGKISEWDNIATHKSGLFNNWWLVISWSEYMVYSMYLTFKETLVGENVTSSLCESSPISTQQYTQNSEFVELGVNSDYGVRSIPYRVDSDLDMSSIFHSYAVSIQYAATTAWSIFFLCLHFITDKTGYNSSQCHFMVYRRDKQVTSSILFLCGVICRLSRPVDFIKLDFAFRYYVCGCCG